MTDTARFIHAFPFALTPALARLLRIRGTLGRQVSNACLGAALRRRERCRRDPRWQEARALPQGHARSARFREVTAPQQTAQQGWHHLL